jgi:outer membrane protein OmpA-like peptidoglycan-associated protein
MSMDTLADKQFGGDMPIHKKTQGGRVSFFALLSVALLLGVCASAFAQDEDVPKYEIFVGYQWLHPGGNVPTPGQPATAPIPLNLRDMGAGAGGSFTYNFAKYIGLTGDYGHNWTDQASEQTLSVGPTVQSRNEGVNLFGNAMISWNHMDITNLGGRNGIGAIVGGGMKMRVTRRFGIRIIEADYVWAHQNFADVVSSSFPGLRRPTFDGARLRTGLEFYLGLPPGTPPSASCSVQPSEVMVGEPITATATGKDFDPKHTLNYAWSSTGGKIAGKDNTASIDTNGIAGGTYTVTANISDAKRKKNGTASCSATFTVKEPPKNPPTMSCSASPTSLQAGGSSTITCTCTSPDNVPVTVGDWNASAGTISGNGNTASLNTTGASAGPITVNATCTDSRGLKSQVASTQVNVENPPPPPPQASKLSQCDFPNKVKPWRVDNTCKAILDDVAKNLQQNADSKLVIVGNADPTEKRKNLAAERAVDSKAYLTTGEAQLGIDPSRIETRTGSGGTKTAEYWIVPAGATFNGEGTQPVDENAVKPVPDHPRAAAKKKAKAAQ